MPYYVDIAAVGIQRYLARTSTLVGRRGASALLVEATSASHYEAGLPGYRTNLVNSEAGDVDGVLSLVLPDPTRRDLVVDTVLGRLRRRLPGAEFQVVEAEADTYLQAYAEQLKPAVGRGEVQLDLPPVAEFPAAALCAICHTDPSIAEVHRGADGPAPGCADCAVRYSSESRKTGRTAEERLIARVGGTRPGGFDELAELTRRRSARTHLATVYADGNQVGRFLGDLARGYDDRVDVTKEAVSMLTMCTFDALANATCAVRGGPQEDLLCVVPHVVGGDDVLVSLPADRAWTFTRRFIKEFNDKVAEFVRELLEIDVEPPTMSAGLVFARKDYSFALAVEHATGCLHQAKSAGAGRDSWIQFHDVTADGNRPGSPVSTAVLTEHADALSTLSGLPASHREQLGTVWQTGGADAVESLATRLGRRDGVSPFLPGRSDEASIAGSAKSWPIDLGDALRIARWWRQ